MSTMAGPASSVFNPDNEFAMYASSRYTYDDAARLAWFWQIDVYDAKLVIGRKLKWRADKVLDQQLHDAVGQWNWIRASPYTAADAEALAASWGVTVEQAKVTGGHMISGWMLVNEAIGRTEEPPHGWFYVVQKGDSLSKIVAKVNPLTSVESLFEANRDVIEDPDLIYPGQVLRIPLH